MSTTDPRDLERIDQEIRINELREEARELTGGQMTEWESPDCPPEIAEQFWKSVVRYEKAPLGTYYQRLLDAGVELPEPESLNDEQLTARLWEVIERLAQMRVFISSTDHLSDRELYAHLVNDSLREMAAMIAYGKSSAYHIDLLGSGSEEDNAIYMKYYADDGYRAHWKKEWPGDTIPDRAGRPYDRDRLLPKTTYAPPDELEDQELDDFEGDLPDEGDSPEA